MVIKRLGKNDYFVVKVDEISKKAMIVDALLRADGDEEKFDKQVEEIQAA